MANPEHLAILTQGVSVWNEWREEHKDCSPDLVGANLNFADLGPDPFAVAVRSTIGLRRAGRPLGVDLIGGNLRGASVQQPDAFHGGVRPSSSRYWLKVVWVAPIVRVREHWLFPHILER